MPAGFDAEVAELFRDLRLASNLSEADLARRLGTRPDVVQALEEGRLYALPPWPETSRIISGYGTLLDLDVGPLLRRVFAQVEAGVIPKVAPLPPPGRFPPADGANGFAASPPANGFGTGFPASSFPESGFQGSGFSPSPFGDTGFQGLGGEPGSFPSGDDEMPFRPSPVPRRSNVPQLPAPMNGSGRGPGAGPAMTPRRPVPPIAPSAVPPDRRSPPLPPMPQGGRPVPLRRRPGPDDRLRPPFPPAPYAGAPGPVPPDLASPPPPFRPKPSGPANTPPVRPGPPGMRGRGPNNGRPPLRPAPPGVPLRPGFGQPPRGGRGPNLQPLPMPGDEMPSTPGISIPSPADEPAPPAQPAKGKGKNRARMMIGGGVVILAMLLGGWLAFTGATRLLVGSSSDSSVQPAKATAAEPSDQLPQQDNPQVQKGNRLPSPSDPNP